jgi:hypothetical protein
MGLYIPSSIVAHPTVLQPPMPALANYENARRFTATIYLWPQSLEQNRAGRGLLLNDSSRLGILQRMLTLTIPTSWTCSSAHSSSGAAPSESGHSRHILRRPRSAKTVNEALPAAQCNSRQMSNVTHAICIQLRPSTL